MISIGDVVTVNFNNQCFTLCSNATVLGKPDSVGDFWIFKEQNGKVHYVSEPCSITKIPAAQSAGKGVE